MSQSEPEGRASRGGSLRSRVRAEMITEIKALGREHLARDGANLSLRAVARDMGMVSSAIYRYFPSRDDLLTALIIDAYNGIADSAESAETAVSEREPAKRFVALWSGARAWAVSHPAEFALVYGSPVPGYQAPQDTTAPAARIPLRMGHILREAQVRPTSTVRLPAAVRQDMKSIAGLPEFAGVPEAVLAEAVAAWAQLIGLISFELFGHLVGTVVDHDAFYGYQLKAIAARLGLSPGGGSAPA